MTRTLTAAVKTEIAKGQVSTRLIVDLMLSTPVYLTNHDRNITWNSNTYQAGGGYLRLADAPRESGEVRVNTVIMELEGVSATWRSLLLAGGHMDNQVIVRRVFLDSADALIANPVIILDGRMAGYNYKEGGASSLVTVAVASHWADFEKTAGRRTNTHSQQLHFSDDTGFRFAAEAVKDILWGVTS